MDLKPRKGAYVLGKRNRILQRLDQGGISIGSWLNLASPLAAEVLASVGYEWLVVDAEHSPAGLAQITEILRAIESRGATALVRVWDDNPTTLGRILDAGSMGVIVPHVNNANQADLIA